jgi:hypothetical protein
VQNVGRQTGALVADGVEQIYRLDLAVAGPAFGNLYDFAHARRYEDPLPHPVITHTEGPLDLRMNVGSGDVTLTQPSFDVHVVFFEEREKHVFRADIIMVMIPAFLLGGAEYSARCRAEM